VLYRIATFSNDLDRPLRVSIVTLCAQLTRGLSAIAKFLVIFQLISNQIVLSLVGCVAQW